MRCGEQDEHTTLPHFLHHCQLAKLHMSPHIDDGAGHTHLQWCFLYKKVKCLPQTGHCATSLSGCQGGRTISLCLLDNDPVSARATSPGGGGGKGRSGRGEDSSTIGSVLVSPALSECILMLEGRRIGESAVVKRRLRSALVEEDESVRGKGREGRLVCV